MNLNPERGALLVIALLTIAAIALSAATITSVETYGTSGGGVDIDLPGGDSQGAGADPGNISGGPDGEASNQETSLQVTTCLPVLRTPPAIFGLVGILAVLIYGVYRRFNAAVSIFGAFAIIPIVVGVWAFLTNCATGGGGGGSGGLQFVPNPGESPLPAPPIPPSVLAGAVLLLMGVAIVAMFRGTGVEESLEPDEEEATGEPDTAAFAQAARRAADRIEESNVPVDNAVYRAWHEMTNLLDIPVPETSAPMDFADAAIEFGLEPDDVHELTRLFNEVRYGHRSAEQREEQAVEILRQIERTYEERAADDR